MSTMQESPFITDSTPQQTETPPMPVEDERIKQFFLEEARWLCPPIFQIDCTEYSKLHTLFKRLKRLERLFTLLYEHNWAELLPDLQKAFSFYLLEGYTPKKERARLIDLLAREISFTTKIAQFNDFITILMQNYSIQVRELQRLLKEYYQPERIEPFPEFEK